MGVLLKKEMAEQKERFRRKNVVLVEFKAPMELVEAFDLKLKTRFSNRSEAIRHLMRVFLETFEGVDM